MRTFAVELARSCTMQLQATMIYVTHDQVEAMTLADRIVVLSNSSIEQVGTPVRSTARPATQFVAGFVGTPRINLVPVRVEDARAKAPANSR